MPASDRPPEPRARPSRTVSAWSSRVCAEQHGHGPVLVGRRVQCRVAGRPGGRLRPAGGADLHRADLDRVEAEGGQRRGNLARALAGAGLQPVVDRHRPGAQPEPRHLERHGCREGQRVGTAACRDQHQVAGFQVGQPSSYGEAHRRDGRTRTHAPRLGGKLPRA